MKSGDVEDRSSVDLADYYARRAVEYDLIYAKPERQRDLASLRQQVAAAFVGKNVLEVACGTGYWTQILAQSAASVSALDLNEEVLAIARSRPSNEKVRFIRGDAWNLPRLTPLPDAALAAFWWSHLEKERIPAFLVHLHATLEPGSALCFIDNRYVEGSSTPIGRTDPGGNTWQTRVLKDGTTHEILKNFPSETELLQAVQPFARDVSVEWLQYYWVLRYRL